MDMDVIYYDTDSIFCKGNHKEVFERYNKKIISDLMKAASDNQIEFSKYNPVDVKGKHHPLGVYDDETNGLSELITLGAKKYCTREGEDQSLHLTVSGVSKKGVKALKNDINNFKAGLVFKYNDAKKLTHYYYDDQEPISFIDKYGKLQFATNQHSIILQPTEYTLGVTDVYTWLREQYDFGDNIEEVFEL